MGLTPIERWTWDRSRTRWLFNAEGEGVVSPETANLSSDCIEFVREMNARQQDLSSGAVFPAMDDALFALAKRIEEASTP